MAYCHVAVGSPVDSRSGQAEGDWDAENRVHRPGNPFPQVVRSWHHNGAMTLVLTQTEVDRETRDGDIVRARLDGLTYRVIAEQVGLSISQCQRIFEAARARRRGDIDLEQHHRDLLNDIEDVLDYLRPWVLGEPVPDDVLPPPTKNPIGDFMNTLKAKREFLALDAPKRTHEQSSPVGGGEPSEDIALFLASLNIWMAKTHTRDEKGWHSPPVLPPEMTERVQPSTPGHEPCGPTKSMWSMAVEFPAPDDNEQVPG